MKSSSNSIIGALLCALLLLTSYTLAVRAQTSGNKEAQAAKQSGTVQPAGTNTAVTGSGTPNKLSKWTGTGSTLGDSVISEDKFGNVGVGTTAPTSKLTVQGMIETTLGGLKFPDGTVQVTAATGNGTLSIIHNTTLTGNGTQASPLGVAVPLVISASAASPLLQITNNQAGFSAISVQGGDSHDANVTPGTGIFVQGGEQTQIGDDLQGGSGLESSGGLAESGTGGTGLRGFGGSGFKAGGVGVFGKGGGGIGVLKGGDGVQAVGGDATEFGSVGGVGLFAIGGLSSPVMGDAGFFEGAVEVHGNLSVSGTKNFKIDYPLDPENKYLYHAAIESSEVLNIYSGNITTDASGEATVTLPDWFEAINRDFRYQLTVVGTFAQAIVGQKIKGNTFIVKTSAPNVEVSWQVTGIRSDAAILKHPFKVEEDKPKAERGSYLTPDAYDKPETKGIQWARNPQLMKQLKERREANRQQQSQPAGDN
jgi:hypothetical protein